MSTSMDRHAAGLSNDEETDWLRKIRRSKRTVEEASGVHRSLLKQAKSAGMNPTKMLAGISATRREPEDVVADMRDEAHYLQLLGVSGVTAEAVFSRDARVTEKTQAEEANYDAEEMGYKAGKAARNIDDNPFEPGTELYVTYRENWHRGQAANAAELSERGEVASGARQHPGRKAANGGGVKAAPAKAPAKKAAARKAPAKADNVSNLH